MPESARLTPLTDSQLSRRKDFKKATRYKAVFPKRAKSKAQLNANFKKFVARQEAPVVPKAALKKVRAVAPTHKDFAALRSVNESTSPIAEIVRGPAKLGPDKTVAVLYSALATYEYTKLQAERKKRLARAKTPAARAKIEVQFASVVEAAQKAFGAAGVRGVTQAKLNRFSRDLRRSKPNFNAVVNIANSGKTDAAASRLTAATSITGGFVPVVDRTSEGPTSVVTSILHLCDDPIAEGSFTKHFSKSFRLRVRLRVWCPTWTNPFRTCVKSFTLAGVSLRLAINVGYRVNCCGAVAWGQASAEACATVIGIKVCASCTGKITGVAGIGRSGSGSNCSYGLGLTAELECKLAGLTVFKASAPFGWTVTGPCPPLNLCGSPNTVLRSLG